MRLLWTDQGWATGHPPESVPGPDEALVVDSFLVQDGRIHDLDVHLERFRLSCRALGLVPDPDRLAAFLAAACRALPVEGRWFPRLEAHARQGCGDRPSLVCWVREAPRRSDRVWLWVPPEPDPRRAPRVKGPDLVALAGLRESARRHRADDALLRSSSGTVLETAHSALLWWRGDVLCHPDPGLPILPSVTARRLLARARAEGVTVRVERRGWRELLDAEVWAVNALHGVRPVLGWRSADGDHAAAPTEPRRLAHFRAEGPGAPAPADRFREQTTPHPGDCGTLGPPGPRV